MAETIEQILEIIIGPYFIGIIFFIVGAISCAWVTNDWNFDTKNMSTIGSIIKIWIIGFFVYGFIQLIIRNYAGK